MPTPVSPRGLAILQALGTLDLAGPTDLSKHLGVEKILIQYELDKLLEQGYVDDLQGGEAYVLTPTGRRLVVEGRS